MGNSTDKKIILASLGNGMPGLTNACGVMLAESAAICLEDRNHQTGVELPIRGLKADAFRLEWTAVDDQQRRCYNDLQEATEWGACCIAILLVRELTGKVVLERSKKGPGFDYWVGQEDDELLFVGKARLEVSGILSGTASTVNSRVAQKRNQIKPSNEIAQAFIAVVEFGNPTAHFEGTA